MIEQYAKGNKQDSVRPISFDTYIGQEHIKHNLKLAISASKKRLHQLDHILFYGPPGLGKTTLATIISHELEQNIKVITGNSIEKAGDIASILMGLEEGDILFIDEIHRLPKIAEETIYSAMEDFTLHISLSEDSIQAKTITIDLPKFTLIGATTRAGMLTKPLRDRFGMNFRLNFYTDKELTQVLDNASHHLDIIIEKDASMEIAKRSRKTPRIALKNLKRLRDFADYSNSNISLGIAKDGLDSINIFEYGLDDLDLKYLETLLIANKPLSLKTIASKISEDEQTIEDSVEPYLLEMEFIEITSRGRIVLVSNLDKIKNLSKYTTNKIV